MDNAFRTAADHEDPPLKTQKTSSHTAAATTLLFRDRNGEGMLSISKEQWETR